MFCRKKAPWFLRIPFWLWIAALLATQVDLSHDPFDPDDNRDSPKAPGYAPAPPPPQNVQA